MKKILSFAFAAMIAGIVVGCGGQEEPEEPAPPPGAAEGESAAGAVELEAPIWEPD